MKKPWATCDLYIPGKQLRGTPTHFADRIFQERIQVFLIRWKKIIRAIVLKCFNMM